MKNESRTQNAPYARACVEEIAPAIMNPGEWQSITFPWLPRNLQNNWNTVRIMSRRRSLHSKFTKLYMQTKIKSCYIANASAQGTAKDGAAGLFLSSDSASAGHRLGDK